MKTHRAFTLLELVIVLAILAILSTLLIPIVKNLWNDGGKAGTSQRQPVGPPRSPSAPRALAPQAYRFIIEDSVMAADLSRVLSNAGFVLQQIDATTLSVQRPR